MQNVKSVEKVIFRKFAINEMKYLESENSQNRVLSTDSLGRKYLVLTFFKYCLTLFYMKTATLTIRLDKDLDNLLMKASKRSRKNRSEIAREALRRQLRLEQFEEIRKRIMPFAEARGFLTDEDIFSKIS